MSTGERLAAHTVAVVLAGGEGSRLGPLTRSVCKPALPFGASFRNIDFSLSNCLNSGIRRIGVATQYKSGSLVRHLAEYWSDAARRRGEFISAWPARTRSATSEYVGTADAVYRNLDLIERHGCGLALVLAGDHVYQMDYRPMLAFHRLRQADVTVGCFEVPAAEASRYGVVSASDWGRIERFVEKPKRLDAVGPGSRVSVSMGIYVFDAGTLARVLRRDAASIDSTHDFGHDVLPRLVAAGRAFAYTFTGRVGAASAYWRDVGTPKAYWQAHMDLLDRREGLTIDGTDWPMRWAAGKPVPAASAAYIDVPGARQSLVASGCAVAGSLQRAVLFGGARVGSGSLVEDSILLPGAVVGRNCRIAGAIVDSDCVIPDSAVVDGRGCAGSIETEPVILTAETFAGDAIRALA